MTARGSFPDWTWENPDECTRRLDNVRAEGARCEKLEPLDGKPPFTRSHLRHLGISGIEFAAFKTAHSSGLAADQLSVRSEDSVTERGKIYRLDNEAYFIELDISERTPFEDGCFDWVYAEHLIEHVPPHVGIRWLTEVRRILSPGGLLRLTTPDLMKYASSYLGEGSLFADHRNRMVDVLAPAPLMPQRRAFMINQIFYFYGHRWIYDTDELRYVLSRAGFDPATVRLRSFRHGARDDIAALDSDIRNDETLYIEVER
jgi:predicted SAM-dependent methyltransferase